MQRRILEGNDMVIKNRLLTALMLTVVTVLIGVSSVIGAENRQRAVHE